MTTPDPLLIAAIAAEMRQAKRLLFITGAGISAESGLPTYRGIGGLYNDKQTEDDLPIERALSGEMFALDPRIPWKYLSQIERSCRGARFNDAHALIASWQEKYSVCVLTQNVDGFHRNAGSRNLIEIHGDIHDLHCTQCDYSETVTDYSQLDMPPQCPMCRSTIRPKVVLFGETLPPNAISQLYSEIELGVDLVFSIGTSSIFPYIAGPVVYACEQGIPTVEINPAETRVSPYVTYKLASGAVDSLRALQQYLSTSGN